MLSSEIPPQAARCFHVGVQRDKFGASGRQLSVAAGAQHHRYAQSPNGSYTPSAPWSAGDLSDLVTLTALAESNI